MGSITGPVKGHNVATAATFFRSFVAQAVNRVDGPRDSLQGS